MLTGILKKIGEFCSLKTPQGAAQNKWKGGFTLIELMIVIAMVNVLTGIVVPKLTNYIELSRQRIDLMKLYYLRDALNRAMYEGDVLDIDEKQTCDGVQNNKEKLNNWLASAEGVTLFIIELHDILPSNIQAKNNRRFTDAQNMCGILSGGGFWADAFKDAGFGAVADILYARDHPQDGKIKSGSDYTAKQVKINNENWWRTYPNKPLFISKEMNGDPDASVTAVEKGGQNRYKFKARWTNGDKRNHTLEIFIQKAHGTDSGKPLTSRLGTCFSTERALCNR